MAAADIIRTGLLWHTVGHNNLGIDALTRANIQILGRAATRAGRRISFVTLGTEPKADIGDIPDGVEIGPRLSLTDALRRRSTVFADIGGCDLVVDIGEGDSFSDLYGSRRFVMQILSKMAAIRRNIPLVLAPQTIGPFASPLARVAARHVINRSTATFARDHRSMRVLSEMGITAATAEAIDVAFRLGHSPVRHPGSTLKVGLNVSALLYHQGYTGKNQFAMTIDYRQMIETLIDRFTAMEGVELSLFAHVLEWQTPINTTVSPEDDYTTSRDIQARFPKVRLAPAFTSAIEAKSWIAGLDFVISGRMHACIAAYSTGVPVVPIAYSRKFNGLFESLGYPFFIDGKTATTESAIETVMTWFAERNGLRSAIAAGRDLVEDKLNLYEDRLVEILRSVPRSGA